MWNKPTNWGGYDTSKGIFYLADKDKNILVTENDPTWEAEYQLWITNKSKAGMFGMMVKEQ